MALRTFVVLLYSVFRAGGMSRFVMLLDAGVMWLVGLPLAFVCYRFLKIRDIAIFYLILQLELVVRIIMALLNTIDIVGLLMLLKKFKSKGCLLL